MIKKEMTVLEIVEKFPDTESIFSSYDEQAGKCLLCECLFDSLLTISEDYNIDLEKFLNDLNKAIKS